MNYTIRHYQKNSFGDFHADHIFFKFSYDKKAGVMVIESSEGGISYYGNEIPREKAEKFFGGEYQPTDDEIVDFNEEYDFFG